MNYARDDLRSLKKDNPSNEELDQLFDISNKLAQMYDHCGSISLNDIIDSTCSHFFEVSLPEFEKHYSKLSGELRIGNMQLAQSIQNRLEQISTCANALKIFYVPIEQIVSTDAEIKDIIPLNSKGTKFSVNYKLTVSYDDDVLNWMGKNAKEWSDKCDAIVFDAQKKEYIPVFLELVNQINDNMKKNGSNVSVLHRREYERNHDSGYKITDEALRFEIKHRTNWWFQYPSVSYILNGKEIENFDIVRLPKHATMNSMFLEIRPKYYDHTFENSGYEVHDFSDKRENKATFSGDYPKNGLKGRWKWDN